MISVVIPTHGRPDLLKETLSSLEECKLPEDYHKLIVVENGSQAGAEMMVRDMPNKFNAEYLYVQRANKSHALNKAIEGLADDLVFFTDDDAFFSPVILTAYASAAKGYKKSVFLGGPVKVKREEEPPGWMEPLLPFSAKGYTMAGNESNTTYLGINWAAFASDIKSLGGFDSQFGPGSSTGAIGQESNMQKRMREAGFQKVDVPGAVVWHTVPRNRCNEEWLQNRYFKFGISKALEEDTSLVYESYQIVKYVIRWGIYSLLMNKMERKKSKMEIITRAGYFYRYATGLFLKKNNRS